MKECSVVELLVAGPVSSQPTKQDTSDNHLHSKKTVSVVVMEFHTQTNRSRPELMVLQASMFISYLLSSCFKKHYNFLTKKIPDISFLRFNLNFPIQMRCESYAGLLSVSNCYFQNQRTKCLPKQNCGEVIF